MTVSPKKRSIAKSVFLCSHEAAAPAATPASQPAVVSSAESSEDYYELLGVSPAATLQEIRTKFRQLVITEHPEKGGDPEKFKTLNKAYGTLSDQRKRAEYDSAREKS